MERNIDAAGLRPEAFPMVIGGCYRASFREFFKENQPEIVRKFGCRCSLPLSTAGSTLILPDPKSRPSAPLKSILYLENAER